MNDGSTKLTLGSSPAAASTRNCATGRSSDRYFVPHSAMKGSSTK
jgi:hypothetical protein